MWERKRDISSFCMCCEEYIGKYKSMEFQYYNAHVDGIIVISWHSIFLLLQKQYDNSKFWESRRGRIVIIMGVYLTSGSWNRPTTLVVLASHCIASHWMAEWIHFYFTSLDWKKERIQYRRDADYKLRVIIIFNYCIFRDYSLHTSITWHRKSFQSSEKVSFCFLL